MTTLELSPDTKLLTPADIEPAAQVIAQAFTDDPLCTFMLPSSKSRLSALLKFFRLYGELNIKNQRGFGAGEPLQGVAYWKTPSQAELSVSVRSLAGFLPLLFSAYPRGYLRAKMILQQIDALHEQYACEPHYYLDNIGVSSASRGQGLASRLIRPFLALADAEQVIAYTDTVTRANVALYEHFGFQCVEERPVPDTGITVWALRRPAT